jgi:microcystin degradation protein MlrC
MARIAVGGFQHATNTFAPKKASYADFAKADEWPGLTRGRAIFNAFEATNIPIAGAIELLAARGHRVVPTLWAYASPSAPVERNAYEQISTELIRDVKANMPLDGVYLDLHGAMMAEHIDDGEGEFLRRLRMAIGYDVPIVASLDLHANLTPAMVSESNGLVAFRSYPHIDMAETGARAAAFLEQLIAGQGLRFKASRHADFLIPLTWQCTLIEPARSLFHQMEELCSSSQSCISLLMGFPAADFPDCGPAIIAYAATQDDAEMVADAMLASLVTAEKRFAGTIYPPDVAVQKALRIAVGARRPVIIADTQDNPGVGGTSDSTGMLSALVRNRATGAVVGLMVDPAAAVAAHCAGVDSTIQLSLGGKSGAPGQVPFTARFRVEQITNGKFTATGPFYRGARMELGPMALLEVSGIRVVVASRLAQAADQEMFRCVGVIPARCPILVLKSSVHFRADFEPIAEAILEAAAPGPMIADPANLPFKRLRPGIRMRPLGPLFKPDFERSASTMVKCPPEITQPVLQVKGRTKP